MTGYFVRVAREGRFLTLDITELSNEELQAFFLAQGEEHTRTWAIALAAWIRDNVREEEA